MRMYVLMHEEVQIKRFIVPQTCQIRLAKLKCIYLYLIELKHGCFCMHHLLWRENYSAVFPRIVFYVVLGKYSSYFSTER
jgi:hypothetical protein